MHAIVAIKQVPDTTIMRIDPETGNLIREGVPAIMNPYDAHALEVAVRLKEEHGGKVTVVSMGPPKAREVIVEAVEQGADQGILITDRRFAGADTWATSLVLAMVIKAIDEREPADIFFFGKQAIDGDTAQVGPGVATRLGVPLITYAVAIEEFDPEARLAVVHRRTERGIEVLKTTLPTLLTVEKEIAKVRFAPLPNLIRAATYKPEIWTSENPIPFEPDMIGLRGSPTRVAKAYTPPPKEPGERIVVTDRGLGKSVAYAWERIAPYIEAGRGEP